MYLGTDPVQLDVYGCHLMGLSTDDVPYLTLAERYGAGSMAFSEDDLVRLNEPWEAEAYPRPSGIVAKLTSGVHADSACSACYAALVRGLYTAREAGTPIPNGLFIGQGWKGKTLSGLGIGNCCAGAENCAQGCPPTAAAVAKMLSAEAERS